MKLKQKSFKLANKIRTHLLMIFLILQIINHLMKKFYQDKKLQYQKEEMQLLKLRKEIVVVLNFILKKKNMKHNKNL